MRSHASPDGAQYGVAAAASRAAYTPAEIAQVRSQTEAALSPSGTELAFVSDITGALELWTVPAAGGWPRQLTSLVQEVHDIRYSPDGKWLYFGSDFGGDDRPDLYRVPAGGGPVENLTGSKLAEREGALSYDGGKLAYTADPGEPFLFQVFTRDLNTGAVLQLTREPVNLHNPVWSRDGKRIAATRSGDDQRGELLILPAAGPGAAVEILPPRSGGIVFAAEFSPDDGSLLVRAENEKGFMQLGVVPASGGKIRLIGPGTWDVKSARWHRTGIFFDTNEGGRSALYHMRDEDSPPKRLLPPEGVIADFDLDAAGRSLVSLRESSISPADAFILDLESGRERQVTFSFVGGMKAEDLSASRIIRYPGADGTMIEALFIAPKYPRLGTPPPVVAHIHGGPDYQAFDDFFPLRQALAEAGIAVFAPNYRGSSGYGREFLDLNNKDWGGKDLEDILAGVRHLARSGEVDLSRAGIAGGSYGGFMTLTALTKSPEFWRAGAESYGMADLALDYELGGKQFTDWYHTEMGSPETAPELFHDRSSIHFLDRIRAPLLIFQGANDTNVPKAQSEGIYAALKARGLAAELVIYPEEGHGFTKRVNRLDWIKRIAEFFSRELAPAAAAAVK